MNLFTCPHCQESGKKCKDEKCQPALPNKTKTKNQKLVVWFPRGALLWPGDLHVFHYFWASIPSLRG